MSNNNVHVLLTKEIVWNVPNIVPNTVRKDVSQSNLVGMLGLPIKEAIAV